MPAKLKIKTGGCTKIVLHWSPCYKYDKGYRTSVFVICKLLLHYLLYLVVSWQNNQRNHIRVVSGIYLCGSCALHTLQIQTSDYTHYVWNWFVMAHINYLEWGTIKKLKHNQDIYQIDVNLKSVITLAVMIPWDSIGSVYTFLTTKLERVSVCHLSNTNLPASYLTDLRFSSTIGY